MSSDAPRSAGRATGLAVLGLTAAAIVATDQATKALVVAGMQVGERIPVLGDLVVLWHVQNRGAAFSLFQGGMILFYAVTVLALAMIVYFHRALRGQGLWLQVVLGLILGGTLGNLIDRLRLGHVTDFVSMGIGDLRWPTYNVADASLVLGILALVGYLTFADPRQRGAEA
ncbi:MAG: signal peptidase II [Candidatus Limnocylindria bacterium]